MYATKIRIYFKIQQKVENLSKLFSVDLHLLGGGVTYAVLHHDLHSVVASLHVAVHFIVQQVVLGVVLTQDPSIVGVHVVGLDTRHVITDLYF